MSSAVVKDETGQWSIPIAIFTNVCQLGRKRFPASWLSTSECIPTSRKRQIRRPLKKFNPHADYNKSNKYFATSVDCDGRRF